MDERIKKQMEFILESEKLKNINRQTYIGDGSRQENDAEHSFSLALMAILLKEYTSPSIDILKVISMVLIHDIVEIDAGDTYAYDEQGNETKREREVAAAKRIFQILPSDQRVQMRNLWEEFEEGKSEEALFAHTLDKVQPILLNAATEGRAWREHKVKASQIYKRNKRTKDGSEQLWEFAKEKIEENIRKGAIIDE